MKKIVFVLLLIVMFVSMPTMAYAGNNQKNNNLKSLGNKIYVKGFTKAVDMVMYPNIALSFCQNAAKTMSSNHYNYLLKQCLKGVLDGDKTSWLSIKLLSIH